MGIGLTADGVTGASQGAMSCQQGQETRSVIERIPYYQLARVAGPQLMVGNVFVVKHASIVPQSALAFARILEEAGAPKGAYTNMFASTDQVARLIEEPTGKSLPS